MRPMVRDFEKYVDRAVAWIERYPMSADEAARRVALEVELERSEVGRLREAVEARLAQDDGDDR
jgi:hypothetical protein